MKNTLKKIMLSGIIFLTIIMLALIIKSNSNHASTAIIGGADGPTAVYFTN